MISHDEHKKREDDPVTRAESDELLPEPQELDKAAEQDQEPDAKQSEEDQHAEVPADQLAKMAGIEPAAQQDEKHDASAPAADESEKKEEAPAPDGHAQEDEKSDEPLEFGPPMPSEDEQKKEAAPAQDAKGGEDAKAVLAGAAGAAEGVAAAAHEDEKQGGSQEQKQGDKQDQPHADQPAHDAKPSSDGFAGTREVGGKQKWNEDAYYKKDKTTGFDVSGKRAVALGKNKDGQVDAADAAVYATAAVETSGTYDAVQTYDKGILSFGIMQWTLHQGSLMKFLDHLKTKSGPDGAAAFAEHFGPLGIDVHGETLIVGGATIKPDDAGRKAMDKLVRADKDTTRRWVTAFHNAGQDERVARAQWVYTKKQYADTAGKTLDKYVGFARKKGYTARHAGSYRTPSFWCRDAESAALFFSMTANNPGYSYYGVIKAADALMDNVGPDPSKWPDGWPKMFTSTYAALLPTLIDSWKGRVEKTLQHLHLANEGKTAAPETQRVKPPHPTPPPAPVHAATTASTPAPQPEPKPAELHGLSWLADVMTRKVVRGLEDASTAAKHFLGIATTGSPHHEEAKAPAPPAAVALATKIAAAAPKGKSKGKGGKLIPKEHLTKGKLSDDQYTFKQKVYEMAVGQKASKKPAFGVMDKDELGDFEGKQLRKDIVPHAHNLLSTLRAELAKAQAAGDDKAKKVKDIGVSSGYRDPEKDFGLWDSYFQKYYEQTHEAREKTGDPHGDAAVKLLVAYIAPRKAPPGFSNHSGGTAMDLHALVDGHMLSADFNNQTRWHESWVWHWLKEHAPALGFHPYDREAWHWEWID